MCRNPWELHFYSDEKAIQIPKADLNKIIKVIKFYKVTHLIPQLNLRPSLKSLTKGKIPGFKLVYDEGLKIYEIQYEQLPQNTS